MNREGIGVRCYWSGGTHEWIITKFSKQYTIVNSDANSSILTDTLRKRKCLREILVYIKFTFFIARDVHSV